MKNEKEKCYCREILSNETGRWIENIYIHLTGCPEDSYYDEYYNLPWYKKILQRSPKSIYIDHIESMF